MSDVAPPAVAIAVTDATHHATVSFAWFDAKGNPITANPPANPALIFSTPDTADLTVDPSTGAITPAGPLTPSVSITVTNPDGTPLSDPAGVVTFTVNPVVFALVAGPPTAATATVGLG